jgi:hypothetical protein
MKIRYLFLVLILGLGTGWSVFAQDEANESDTDATNEKVEVAAKGASDWNPILKSVACENTMKDIWEGPEDVACLASLGNPPSKEDCVADPNVEVRYLNGTRFHFFRGGCGGNPVPAQEQMSWQSGPNARPYQACGKVFTAYVGVLKVPGQNEPQKVGCLQEYVGSNPSAEACAGDSSVTPNDMGALEFNYDCKDLK